MKHVREGKTLGEAIEASVQMMHVHIHFQTKVTKATPSLNKEQIQQLINAAMKQKGKGKGGNQNNVDRSRSPRGGGAQSGGPSRPRPKCNLFNSEEGCTRKSCRFDHSCSKCGSKNHGAAKCTKKD